MLNYYCTFNTHTHTHTTTTTHTRIYYTICIYELAFCFVFRQYFLFSVACIYLLNSVTLFIKSRLKLCGCHIITHFFLLTLFVNFIPEDLFSAIW